MRAGLNTIQQTLMPDAANILNHAIAEARKRNHGQTTPLHVAATLLASPSGYLRQACIRSHPNSSHPLQCRALELCFSVALERLPCAQGLAPGLEPPISNALMAALKRAQAHQRRGCPEQHQQPLLAVKVELEQLIVSILDDPSVSRVMREASFSSPAVKATIEQSLNSSNSQVSSIALASSGLGYRLGNSQSILGALGRNQQQHFENGIRREDPGPRPITIAPRNLYLNPRLQQAAASAAGSCDQSGQHKEDVKKVLDIMSRGKRRNPILVGQTEPEAVIGELLKRIEQKDIDSEVLRTVQVVSVEKELASVCVEGCDKSQITTKFTELGSMVESRIGGGLVLNLGDLKWLVGQPGAKGGTGGFGISVPGHAQQVISEIGQILVAEMGRLLLKNVDSGRLWLIGTATCETYFRCQIYHPSMEKDWDLHVLPIAARSPHPGLFPRIGGNGIISSSVESFNPSKGFPVRRVSENTDSARRMNCCPQCTENYEQDVAKMDTEESEKSSSDAKPEAQQQQQPLPQWLQVAKPNNGINGTDHNKNKDQELILKQKREELQKKWIETCCRLHPGFHPNTNSERSQTLPIQLRQPFQPRLQLTRTNSTLQTIQTPATNQLQVPGISNSPPTSPVRTDLVLGRPKNSTETLKERLRDTTGCIPSQPQKPTHQFSGNFSSNHQVFDKISAMLDADSFKRLFKGLTERVGWQSEAAAAVATTVMQCRSGTGKRRGVGLKSDTWLMFLGFDRVGKKKMAMAVSELVFANKPVLMIKLGSSGGAFSPANEEDDTSFRGKTVLDRITETVRQNPFSVIVLEDFDQADLLVQDGLKRAMEKGRLADSHGREVSLGSVIFVLTADWLPEKSEKYPITVRLREEKLAAAAVSGCPLQLSVKTGQLSSSTVTANNKHRAEWLREAEEEQIRKRQKEDPPPPELQPALSIDLNLTAEDNETVEVSHSSRDSSDVTVEHGITKRSSGSIDLILRGISDYIDDAIVFKPVDFDPLKEKIVGTVTGKFKTIFSSNRNAVFEMDDQASEHMVGAVWFGRGFESFEEWADRVLVHGFREIQSRFPSTDDLTVRLVTVKTAVTDRRAAGDWLPGNIPVMGQ